MARIDSTEIEYSYVWAMDDIGRVFFWNGGVFRGIYPQAADRVRELFSCGCLEELTRRGLVPKSRITEHTLDGYAFVIEHERIPYVTYAHEWSFTMLRDAALAVLEISDVLARYGRKLRDCHYQNVLFAGDRPVYVDLGSIAVPNDANASAPGPEFLSSYFWPLAIWSRGDYFLARRILSSGFGQMPIQSWQLYSEPLLRLLGLRWGMRVSRRWKRLLNRGARLFWGSSNSVPANAITARLFPSELVSNNTGVMREKILRLPTPSPTTAWSNYHDQYLGPDGLRSTPRFDRLLQMVRQLGGDSVVDLAGNQGLFSLLLVTRTQVERVVCADVDASAINQMYGYCRQHKLVPSGKTVQPAVVNFMVPEINFASAPPAARFRADLVVALAITHHLTLVQSFPVREVMRAIASYTKRYAIVEFMPLGLWDGQKAPPIPDWYNLDWFQKAFGEFFELCSVEKIEANRIVHVGRLRNISTDSPEETNRPAEVDAGLVRH